MNDNKAAAAYHGESQMDHAWRTIPAECRTDVRPVRPAQGTRRDAATGSLHVRRHIVTIACYSAVIVPATVLFLAWFLDWKMP